jgi:hypothetical protein
MIELTLTDGMMAALTLDDRSTRAEFGLEWTKQLRRGGRFRGDRAAWERVRSHAEARLDGGWDIGGEVASCRALVKRIDAALAKGAS